MDVAYSVRVRGRVTGVGFRYSAIHYAHRYSMLRGYIRNVGYAEVEALFQGKREDVDDMIAWMQHGPSMARVDEILINEVPVDDGLGYFDVRY